MLADTVTVEESGPTRGEQSSKARPSTSRRLCSFARFARSDHRSVAEEKPGQGEQRRGMA
jgi:hypothetical protein